MRIVAILASCVCACGALAGSAEARNADDPGVVVSPGAQPYTETWTEIVVRSPFRPNPDLPEPPPHVLTGAPGAGGAPTPNSPGWSVRGPGPAPCPTLNGGWVGNTYASGATATPPSPAIAVGPHHILELSGGQVSIYDRSGTRLSNVPLTSFFTLVDGSTTYPRNGARRPRAMYAPYSGGRFYVTALEGGNPLGTQNHLILAVSRTADPTGTWDKYVLPIGEPTGGGVTWFTDWYQIGIDGYGLVASALLFSSEGETKFRAVATRWGNLIQDPPTLGPVTAFEFTGTFGPPIPSTALDYGNFGFPYSTWLVNITTEPALEVRRIVWSSGYFTSTPTLESAVASLPVPTFADRRSFFALGSTLPIHAWDYRVTALVRDGNTLWTCNSVGTNAMGTETASDRVGVDWNRISLGDSAATGTRTLADRGRVYDPSAASPISYAYPTLAVTSRKQVTLAFTGGGLNNHLSGFACGRLPTDGVGVMRPVAVVKAGEAGYTAPESNGGFTWGLWSGIAPDPLDGTTVWSALQYGAGSATNNWGVHIGRLVTRPPQRPTSTTPMLVPRGFQGSLELLGANSPDGERWIPYSQHYFDNTYVTASPTMRFGDGTVIRSAYTDGSGVLGASINPGGNSAYAWLAVVRADAPLGPLNATFTNPDGQSATSSGPVVTIVEPTVPNDWCMGAQAITPAQLPFDQTVDVSQATYSPIGGSQDLWYHFTAPSDGAIWWRAESVPLNPDLTTHAISVSDCNGAGYALSYVGSNIRPVRAGERVLLTVSTSAFPDPISQARLQLDFFPATTLESPCVTAPTLALGVAHTGHTAVNSDLGTLRNLHTFTPQVSGWYVLRLSSPVPYTWAVGYRLWDPCRIPFNFQELDPNGTNGYGLGYTYVSDRSNGAFTGEPFRLEAGVPFWIVVASSDWYTSGGPYTLIVEPASALGGATVADALPISLPSIQAFNTAQGAPGSDRPTLDCGAATGLSMTNDRWFRFVPEAPGTVGVILRNQAAASGTTGALRLAAYIYPQSNPATNPPLACSGSPDKAMAEMTFPVNIYTTYYIQVASASTTAAAAGELEFTFTPATNPSSIYACCLPGECTLLRQSTCSATGGELIYAQGSVCVPTDGTVSNTFALTANATPVPIPDATTGSAAPGVLALTANVQVPGNGRVRSVQVRCGSLTHTYAGDLVMRLQHAGRSVDVANRAARTSAKPFGASANFSGEYTFADSASNALWTVADPLGNAANIPAGAYQPGTINALGQSLDLVMQGAPLNGEWTLRIEDFAAQDIGSIADVSLTITYAPGATTECSQFGACCPTQSFATCHLDSPDACRVGFLGLGTTCQPGACPAPNDASCEMSKYVELFSPTTFVAMLDTSAATTNTTDPTISCDTPPGPAGRSVWYRLFGSESTVHVRLDGACPFDRIIAAYRSDDTGLPEVCGIVEQVGCANEPEPNTMSFPTTPSSYHYYIVVGTAGSGSLGGQVRLTISNQPIVPSVVCRRGSVCTIEPAASCAGTGSGVVEPGLSCSPVTICNFACCRGSACTVEPAASCTGTGSGVVQPSGTCSPTPCNAACCRGTACTVESAASCAVGGGVLFASTACTPDPCPIACCRFGQCTLETPAACAVDGGQALTSTVCSANSCSVYCCRGATCVAVPAATCMGVAAGSVAIIRSSCGAGNDFATCCYADFNHDGTQSIDDLFLYINAYFTTHPLADFGGSGISQPTIDDLFLFINAYFGTCS